MAKFGFLSVLEEELDKHLDYDFAMDWDKKNHAVEVTFILEAQNSSNIETIDDKGEVSDEDVIFAETLNEVATEGLNDLMDFLSDDGPEEFGLVWDKEAFEKGKTQLEEKEFFAYPRY